MSLELDNAWEGWHWVKQAFLLVYTFELIVRVKAFGCRFFVNEDWIWNNMDFSMVLGGVFNLWLMPAWSMVNPSKGGTKESGSPVPILKFLRLTQILGVLRLVRLLRMVKPLYHLLMGVILALDAMKWVMILTLLVLYGGAVVFTCLIGHGYIYASVSDVPPEAEEYFGTVPQSIFSLFKLMNGDTSVVEPITTDVKGRLLFVAFMILSTSLTISIMTKMAWTRVNFCTSGIGLKKPRSGSCGKPVYFPTFREIPHPVPWSHSSSLSYLTFRSL